jgi:regulatory protein YycI of two-component signal transduction system YycFG
MTKESKIIRTWRGWTTIENAPIYENMLINDVFPTVKKKGVIGLEKVSISTQTNKDEVEFFLVLQFDSLEAVKTFAGENYKLAYIPENAQRVLKRYDQTAEHFELKDELILNEK